MIVHCVGEEAGLPPSCILGTPASMQALSVPQKYSKVKKTSDCINSTPKPLSTIFVVCCGIYTHHQRRSNPDLLGFNVACLEGINPLKIDKVPTYDGVHHPADLA